MKRKKVWFMGLAMLVATMLIFGGHEPSTSSLNLPARAQEAPQIIAGRSGVTPFLTPPPPPKPRVTVVSSSSTAAPTPGPGPTPSAAATEAPKPGPTPSAAASPAPTPGPSPTTTPTATPKPEAQPEASPLPAVPVAPATTANPTGEKISAASVPLSDRPYKDPQGRFEVGILENYNVSAIADAPLIESPDGNMAYTVVVHPKITNEQFSNQALAQMAINQFQRGEGFQPNQLQVLADGELLIPWTGTVTIGRNTQPIGGSILVRQNSDRIVMLLLSATENTNVDSAIATLSDSLKSL